MKTISLQFIQMIFAQSKRLLLLLLLLLFVVAYASSNSPKYARLTAKIHTQSTGSGCVYVTENGKSSEEVCNKSYGSELPTSGENSSSTYQFTFTLNAKADKGSYVAGWTTSSTSIESLQGGTTHTVILNGEETEVSETWYAVFKSIVALPEPNKVSIKVIAGESSPTMVKLPEVVNTTQLTLSIAGDDTQNSWFKLSKDNDTYESSISFASSALELSANGRVTDLPFYVKFVGTMDNATDYDKNVVIRVTAPTEAPDMFWDIPIEVTSEYDTYQFLRPQIVGVTNYEGIDFGTYTATLADPDKTSRTITNLDDEPISLATSAHYSVTLKANPSNRYEFYGWYKITFNEDGTEKNPELVSQSATYGPVDFKESAKIYPLYVRSEQALFRIKDDVSGKLYYDLQEALNIAAVDKKIVVFNAPEKGTTGTLYPKAGGGAYTIPSGVTLLIPGDAEYTCRTKYSDNLPDSDFPADTNSLSYSFYSKLSLADDTKITLDNGNICVYSTLSSAQPNNGSPVSYGWIEMGENCEIATTSTKQSYLYVLGYITGPTSLSSSIQLNEGSTAYESFQITDFRGGTVLSLKGVANNKFGVFPTEQFYIQNIEVPMTIKSGATLSCIFSANVSFMGLQKIKVDLISQKSGLIQLTNNVKLIKYYDSGRDVQVYNVIGEGKSQSSAKIGNVALNISGISMNSSDFVLPITSNMEITFDDVTMHSDNRVGMLAGSKIWIKENAEMYQNAQFYVHDKVENKYVGTDGYQGYNGYFGSTNEELIPVRHTPNGTHLSTPNGTRRKRTVDNLTSAQLQVDGKLNITGNGLYTTVSGADIVSNEDGAQINFASPFKEAAKTEKLHRLRQNSNEAVQYPVLSINPAWLKNSDGTYVETTGDAVTYEYYITGTDQNDNPIGIWSLPPTTVTDDSWSGTSVTATMPTTPVSMTVTCRVENVTSKNYTTAFVGLLDGTGFSFANGDLANSVSFNDNVLSVAIMYTPQNNTAQQHNATLTLKNAQIQTEEFTYKTILNATEEYIPSFELDKSTLTLVTKTNSCKLSKAFTITPAQNNVATLGSTDGLTWSYSILNKDDNDKNTLFGYSQGTLDAGKIADNTVTFNTTETGTQYARLEITATYQPKPGDAKSYSQIINLIGTQLAANTLDFDMESNEMWVTDFEIPVKFKGNNNESAIGVTLVENGEEGTPIAELVEKDGSYYINALRAGSFTIQATQEDDVSVVGTTILYKITVKKLIPNPTWNWSVVYGNQSYTLPFDPATVVDGKWILTETSDPVNALAYDENTHTIQVMNVGQVTSAQFKFTQDETDIYNEFTKSYSVTINPDPRILTLVVDNKAKFDIIVSEDHSEGVVCSENGMITLPANGYVILQFIGIPGDLTFQLNDADYNSILVAENIDKTSDDTWQEIAKSNSENKWLFAKINSSCVKITNNSANTVILSNLVITENSIYNRNTYYAKAEAIVSPAQAGQVAAKGNYLNANLSNEELFTTSSSFASRATAYSLAGADMIVHNDQLAFSFQAQSTPGYYFSNWTSVGNPMITGELSWAGTNKNYELSLNTTASDKSIAYFFDTYINLFCQQNQDICAVAKPESGTPNADAVAYMNAGALALIPATNVGTWQANFALAEVVSVEDVAWESNSPKASDVVKADVVFNVLGDDVNDFEPSIEGVGFSFNPSDATLSVISNTYTVKTSYIPQDIHGTHTATLTLSRVAIEGVDETSSKTATLTVIEDLTPSFTLADGAFGEGTLGEETIIDIVPAAKNTIALVSNPAKLAWTASLSDGAPFEILSVAGDGTCRVRYFRTASGNQSATLTLTATYKDSKGTEVPYLVTCELSGSATGDKSVNTLALVQNIVMYVDDEPVNLFSVNNPNNNAPITITLPDGCTALKVEDGMLKPSGDFTTGTYTIKVSQVVNDYFQASGELTTTVTVKKHTPTVTWNLNQLYFGLTYETPITTDSDGALNITPSGDGADIVNFDASARTIKVDQLTEGEYDVTFTVSLAVSDCFEAFTGTYTALIYKDPRHLRVDVNSQAIYDAVTIANQTGANVSYNAERIQFADVAGSDYTSRQWTMYFIGVPDQLFFTPMGNNAWQIQESPNGSNWNTTYASAKIPAGKQFSMSLRPNTRYVRISYASNADGPSDGALTKMYITPLQGVKTNVDGMYLAIAADPVNNPTVKNLLLQYVSNEDLTVYTSDPQFIVSVASLPAVADGEYGEQTITITSKATIEKEGRLFVKNSSDEILLELPIRSFVYPQTLPVQLATDNAQRFYYLATATNYVKWDINSRIITMQNASPNTTRSFTFAFNGAPSIIRFNHTAADKGTWTIRESANNADWNETNPATRVVDGSELEQGLLSTTRYVKVEYTSPYSEAVEISDLIIVGNASVTTDVTKLEFTDQQRTKVLTVTAINLADFEVCINNSNFTATFDESLLTATGIVDIPVSITWTPNVAIDNAVLTIVNPNDGNAVLATVELLGTKLSIDNPANTGIFTGVANSMELRGGFEGSTRRPVILTNAYDAATGKALFDYLYIYGETSTMDGSNVITTPTTQQGSNAKTPCYIYKRVEDAYQLLDVVDNVNSSSKAISGAIIAPVNQGGVPTRIYITGFAPYASTGYTKEDEGVWLFRGAAGSKLDIYLEDCYIYSRYKTVDGHSFLNRDNGESFSEGYVRGSGGVLIFECSSVNNTANPFDVTIHTRGSNLLKSHYGCFMASLVGRAYQVSSPIQIHLMSSDVTATTHLTFDDIWPTSITRTIIDGVVTEGEPTTIRTNGFLSLQKQVNNAPSIDMGNANTVVNFKGGQVELQNALNSSDNYESTLAISYRTGQYGPAQFRFTLSLGVGTDGTGGTVNFYDGTTTVIPMEVAERYRQYYLMDKDEQGKELTTTSCLRCPANTYVYGGSHCMMRACPQPTDKGGAPKSGPEGDPLGLYKYPYSEWTDDKIVVHKGGWTPGNNGLVIVPTENLPNSKYGVESVTPNTNGTDATNDDFLNFWVTSAYDSSVKPEVNASISFWKACMTYIQAKHSIYSGEIGGETTIQSAEEVYNLLYCVIDENIRNVIKSKDYAAPVLNPAPTDKPEEKYLSITPTQVGNPTLEEPELQNYVTNAQDYKVEKKVYYIVPAVADIWMNFTAPFDVEKVWVVETYDESYFFDATCNSVADRTNLLKEQAEHNADFAAFFGVALALESKKPFEDIFNDYIGWAKLQDQGKYTGAYNLRGKYELEHYYRMPESNIGNWNTASYYLYKNGKNDDGSVKPWTWDEDNSRYVANWEFVLPTPDVEGEDYKFEPGEAVMKQGESYSMLFPYSMGVWNQQNKRNFWDYWTGKFLIFESTDGGTEGHEVYGSDYLNTILTYDDRTSTILLGNPTFAQMTTTNEKVWTYSLEPNAEGFNPPNYDDQVEPPTIIPMNIGPTESFLLTGVTLPMNVARILRTGEIVYRSDNNGDDNGDDLGTGNHVPTINGDCDIFVTPTAEGINIAVEEPQYVGVFSVAGQLIYNGWVETAVDVALVNRSVYVVVGENNSVKVIY